MLVDLVPVQSALLDRLTPLGVDVARVLREAGLPRSRFEGGKAQVSTRELYALWNALEHLSPSPDIGLRLGSEIPLHQYNVASMAALHAATLGDALAKLGRYKRLVCPEDVVVEVVKNEARVRFQWLLAEGSAPPFLIDGTFASVVELARRGTGESIVPRRVDLSRRRKDEAILRRHFGCEIRFDAPIDRLVLDAAMLDKPFITHNADLLALLVPGLDAELAQRFGDKRGDKRGGGKNKGATGALTDDVRSVLTRRICGERPSVDTVARELGMSGRTLQRRLEELGTHYQELLDQVRRQSARRLLANTDLDSGEVAFLLGFEELNSFTRAFRSWEGTTPSRWRSRDRSRQATT